MNAENASGTSKLLQSGLELRSRQVLEAGLSRIDARTRSRLNQARQAAVAETSRSSVFSWLNRLATRQALMPATGAAAVAVLVAALVLTGGGHQLNSGVTDNPASALDVLDLVTDDDAMNLMEDNDGSFYEWAAAQSDGGQAAGPGAGGTTT